VELVATSFSGVIGAPANGSCTGGDADEPPQLVAAFVRCRVHSAA
jgi:hypothetical protein